MDNFKFNFPSWGQIESLSLDEFFLVTVFKILACHAVFLPLMHECSTEIILYGFT